jgi:hypothetical protein
MQFPNCLAYKDIDDCVVKLQYALTSTPEPLSESGRRVLSWDGATDRLYEQSSITVRDAEERRDSGMDEADMKAAKFHVETAKRSHFVSSLFSGKILSSPKSKA